MVAHTAVGAPPARRGRAGTVVWIAAIFGIAAAYFLAYALPTTLHDASHYAAAGVSMVRDHQHLIYPYHAHLPPDTGPAYENFQKGTIEFGLRTDYPAKLHSLIFGTIWALSGGEFHLAYLHWMSFGLLFASSVLVYLIAREFLAPVQTALLLLAVWSLPMMRTTMAPGTDAGGLFVVLLLTWLIARYRINPLLLGVVAGVVCHLRGQSLAVIVVVPFIYAAFSDRSALRSVLPFGATCLVVYFLVGQMFDLWLGGGGSPGGISFYLGHFSRNLMLDQLPTVLAKLHASFVALFSQTQLFYLGPVAIILLTLSSDRTIRNLTLAALIYVLLPLITYSFDSLAPPQARYFIPAVPLIALAVFIFINRLREAGTLRSATIPCILIALIGTTAWFATHGASPRQLDIQYSLARMAYLDFDGAQAAMEEAFTPDSIVIVNHSLPTAIAPIHKVIYVPPLPLFQQGDNRAIDGMVFVYSNDRPNDFFAPEGWVTDGKLPDVFTDAAGITFRKVYEQTSLTTEAIYGATSTSYFVIFKRDGAQPSAG